MGASGSSLGGTIDGWSARRRAVTVLAVGLVPTIAGALVAWKGPDAAGFAVIGVGIGILVAGCLLVFPNAFLEARPAITSA